MGDFCSAENVNFFFFLGLCAADTCEGSAQYVAYYAVKDAALRDLIFTQRQRSAKVSCSVHTELTVRDQAHRTLLRFYT